MIFKKHLFCILKLGGKKVKLYFFFLEQQNHLIQQKNEKIKTYLNPRK